jgi:hypothetical protein
MHDLNPKCTSTNPDLVMIFFMPLHVGMMSGRRHGHQLPPIEEKNPYIGQKSGYLKTWEKMFEFLLYHMILILWVFIIMLQISTKPSFIVW